MKLELKTLRYSMINNLIISIIKVVGGLFFGLGSLFADGLHTFSDFITDIISMIGTKISNKRPTKYHPFGFGKVEYLTNLFVGALLFMLAIFIIVSSFFKEAVVPPLRVLLLLAIVFILKLVAIYVMNNVGKKINSHVLVVSVQESKTDLYSSIGVIIITILLQFSDKIEVFKYADLIGSITIGLIVLRTSLKIIISNSLSLIGEIDDDEERRKEVEDYLSKYRNIIDNDMEIVKYGAYYKLHLVLELKHDISLRSAEKLMKKIKYEIVRHKKLKIRFVTIFITDKIKKK
ncbi:MAG: cation diffusion facilitator family transporter [Bacilli bacterium]|nr:cation diffusion facilitator family transporter [Bacilli bacterium]